jgi:hypothetical protein
MHLRTSLRSAAVLTVRRLVAPFALVAAALMRPPMLDAQAHDHAAHAAPARDARLDLLLGGPHVILYHRGYLALGAEQVAALQPLRRAVCDAEQVYVQQGEQWRDGLSELLGDSASLAVRGSSDTALSARLHDAMMQRARAESQWISVLMQTRRDALALLTSEQRTQMSALRDHWARESMAMIAEATRPGQRGHPGMQIPIRVPGMVVGETTLLPSCEVLHGPSTHISIPPPG